jgi:hypothetical protein
MPSSPERRSTFKACRDLRKIGPFSTAEGPVAIVNRLSVGEEDAKYSQVFIGCLSIFVVMQTFLRS